MKSSSVRRTKTPLVWTAKYKLRDDGVAVADGRAQSDLARRRRKPVSGQISRSHDIFDKFRHAQTGEDFDELLDAAGVHREFFTGDFPVVRALPLQSEIIFAAHFDFGDGRGQFEQVRVAEIIHRAVPRRQRVFGGRHDRVPAFALDIDLRRIIRRTFAGVQAVGKIRAVAEPQVQVGGLQTERGQISLRVVGDKLRDLRGLQMLQRIGDAVAVGARLKRPQHSPKTVRRVAAQFDDFCAVGQHDGIKIIFAGGHERRVAPVVGRMRDEFQPVGVGHERAVHADDAEKNLVAGRGLVADEQLPALVASLDDE